MRGRRRTRSTVLAVTVVAAMMLAAPASAHTPAMDRLERAGWTCLSLGPLGYHCFNGPTFAALGDATSVSVRVFQVDEAGHETYEGTEVLIHARVFERSPNAMERPCPQDGGHWHSLAEDGLPYYACHHYDTGG